MILRYCYVAFVLVVFAGVNVGNEFTVAIVKVDGDSIVIRRINKGQHVGKKNEIKKNGPDQKKEEILVATSAVRVYDARIEAKTSKVVSGEELFGGLENEQFQAAVMKGGMFWITTNDTNQISEIRFFLPQQPKGPQRESASISNLSPQDLQLYDYVITGIRTSRNQIKSGIFRATGQYTQSGAKQSAKDFSGDVEIRCAFDWDTRKLRFDRTQPARKPVKMFFKREGESMLVRKRNSKDWKQSDAQEKKPNETWELVPVKTSVVFSPKEVVQFKAQTIKSYLPEQEEVSMLKRGVFDIRAIGMYGWVDFGDGTWLDDIVQRFEHYHPKDIHRETNGLWTISWETELSRFLETVWVDELKGFSVLRHEIRVKEKKDPAKWADPVITSSVSWVKQEDTWVPTTFYIQSHTETALLRYDLAVEWISLNQPIPEKVFSAADFDVEGMTRVVDMKIGRPILTDILNPRPGYGKEHTDTQVYDSTSIIVWLTVVNIGVVVLVIAYIKHKRKLRAVES